ncbi:MAG TPA: S53 family peptidase [Streptosporangiaceae bacterium]
MRRMNPRMAALVAAAALTTGAMAWGAQTATAAPDGRHTLAGSVPSWAKAASKVGEADGAANVGFRVYLGWRDQAGAESLATAVSTPGSGSYGGFLTAAQFRARFAPSQSDVSAVQQWLRKSGFDVTVTPGNNRYVQAEGTVDQAAAAFGAKFGMYKVEGRTLRAPESELSVPAALPSSVTAVVGLDQSTALLKPYAPYAPKPAAPPAPAFVNAPPCSAYWNEKNTATTKTPDGTQVPGSYPWAPCGYTPAQLRGAYGVAGAVASGNDGTGQTVAIIDAYASPTILQDVNTYADRHGLPRLTGSTFTEVTPPGAYNRPENNAQDPQGWYGEETLDVEAVHGVAPGAKIVYVGAPNNYQDLDAAMNHVVDQHLASIVTNSYGFSTELLPPGYVKPFNDTLIEAAATGIGVYFSSGDNGDETDGDPANFGRATPDWPAASPWVTAVGGTSLAVGADDGRLFETGWVTGRSMLAGGTFTPPPPGSFLYASGGGTSRLFAQPAYQAGVVPDAIATANGARAARMRVVPDVAAVGDPNTGYLIGQTQTFPDGTARYSEYRLGGTSLASPVYAGLVALAQQKAGRTFGFANPLFYARAGTAAFHDIQRPAAALAVARDDYVNGVDAGAGYAVSLRSLDVDSLLTIHVRNGYDDVTGIGTPNGDSWLTALSR